ncbi:unnamed protein product [Prorocentrum cordatum]|uniref:Uncharacterized protein n=1 Tax=Prorocentrum cordatum TaxID=2364126 RepID=A0ABN9QYV6_9DINO|nr:unnamed protein product [Polarella glacialis]
MTPRPSQGFRKEPSAPECLVGDLGRFGTSSMGFVQSAYRCCLSLAAERASDPALPPGELRERARSTVLYICAFCNNQWDASQERANHSVNDSVFCRVLRAESTVCAVLNIDDAARVFERAWCQLEVLHARLLEKRLVLNSREGPLHSLDPAKACTLWTERFAARMLGVDIGRSCATDPEDLERIRAHAARCKLPSGAPGMPALAGAEAFNAVLRRELSSEALPFLAKAGDEHSVEEALRWGASPDALDSRHLPALTYAAARPPACGVAEVLRRWGADPRASAAAADAVAMFGAGEEAERLAAIARIEALEGGAAELFAPAAELARGALAAEALQGLREALAAGGEAAAAAAGKSP